MGLHLESVPGYDQLAMRSYLKVERESRVYGVLGEATKR